MNREMRRKDRLLTKERTVEVLEQGEYGVLSLIGDEGFPYGVPVNFVYFNDSIYMHCSTSGGYKRDAIEKNEKVSFTTVSSTEVIPSKFGTKFSSAIAFGVAKFLDNDGEKKQALDAIIAKYSTNFQAEGHEYIKTQWSHTDVIKISITELTGKART